MRRIRNGVLIGLLLVIGALTTFATSAPSAPAQSSDTEFFLGKINELRTSLGLQTMSIEPELQALSEQWAPVMASSKELIHPHVTDGITVPYLWVGDNIAFGPTNEVVWVDFVNSPVHYTNLVDPRFDRVGIGTAVADDGSKYVITRFLASAPEVTPEPEPEPVLDPPAVDPTEPLPEVGVLAETLIKPVNMAVIPAVRYGITTEAAAVDQPESSSNLLLLLLALALAVLLIVAAALFIQSRRRAARI